ncbi:MAG: hypothetical protein ACXVA4_04820, partial [Ktedonobacterales bacterium]
GMSGRLGLISFSDRQMPFMGGGDIGQRDFSEATASVIDDETRDLVQSAYQQVRQLLTDHRVTLERIAQELRRHETLDAKQLSQILMETGVSLAEVAPMPNAETVAGIKPEQSEVAPNAGNGIPNLPTYPDGLGTMQN